jgi:hypothetical protein
MMQHSMGLTFSRRLALVFGLVTPLAETIRRWHQLGQPSVWPMWFDDLLLGSFLLYASWLTKREPRAGRPYLAGAWGVTVGMAYASFFGQLQHLSEPDPAPIGAGWVVGIKGVGLLLAIGGLAVTLKAVPER